MIIFKIIYLKYHLIAVEDKFKKNKKKIRIIIKKISKNKIKCFLL